MPSSEALLFSAACTYFYFLFFVLSASLFKASLEGMHKKEPWSACLAHALERP
jgi:hypothetical protein